jgi:hypothetical protein
MQLMSKINSVLKPPSVWIMENLLAQQQGGRGSRELKSWLTAPLVRLK